MENELIVLLKEYQEYKLLEEEYLKNNDSDNLKIMIDILYRLSNATKIISQKLKEDAELYKMKSEKMTFRNVRDTMYLIYDLVFNENIGIKRVGIGILSTNPKNVAYIESYIISDYSIINEYFEDDLYEINEFIDLINDIKLENKSFIISSSSTFNNSVLPINEYNYLLKGLNGNIYCYLNNDELSDRIYEILKANILGNDEVKKLNKSKKW